MIIHRGKEGIEMKRLQYPGPTKVMTVRELSDYLHCHPSTIYRLVRSNQIPAFHIGSDWRFNIETIDHWRRQQEKTGN
jgi:excisionase family DNA binding protein